MLDREQIILWAERLVAFLNEDVDGAYIERELSTIAKCRHRTAAHYEELRDRADETVRWLMTRQPTDAMRIGVGEEWLTRDHVTANSEVADIPMYVCPTYDASGQLVATWPQVRSVDAFVAVTIAELLTAKCAVDIRECAFCDCDQLLVRKRGRGAGRGGRLKEFCDEGHADTWRNHRDDNCSECLRRRNRK